MFTLEKKQAIPDFNQPLFDIENWYAQYLITQCHTIFRHCNIGCDNNNKCIIINVKCYTPKQEYIVLTVIHSILCLPTPKAVELSSVVCIYKIINEQNS